MLDSGGTRVAPALSGAFEEFTAKNGAGPKTGYDQRGMARSSLPEETVLMAENQRKWNGTIYRAIRVWGRREHQGHG